MTEIPFPRSDNLCTRFATEITLQRASVDSLQVSLIPDQARPAAEQDAISTFSETINDFSELPSVMEAAKEAMGIGSSTTAPRSFAQDVLSIRIEGPRRPQLTLVDVPGLIQTETQGSTKEDREMVARITEDYIPPPRTICLAVISATDDYANQPILTRVREVDPNGERTLGIITQPDRLEPGSGMENEFVNLARDQDIIFKLGWHVVKNRGFKETACSLSERNRSEILYFESSRFQELPEDGRGITTLRTRPSALLFEHVKRELPSLRQDLDVALKETEEPLGRLGVGRTSAQECRRYLTHLSSVCLDITKKAVDGDYREEYIQLDASHDFDVQDPLSIRRLRAVIQLTNVNFEESMRQSGRQYGVARPSTAEDDKEADDLATAPLTTPKDGHYPMNISRKQALGRVERVLHRSRGRSRGRETMGNYNPLIVAELFWEQSSQWKKRAEEYVEPIATVCARFMTMLLEVKCPRDVQDQVMGVLVSDVLQTQYQRAMKELGQIIEDNQDYPSVTNH